jgi:CBS domain-containing protein
LKSATPEEHASRKQTTIINLYRYSDLSVEAISQQVDIEEREVQKVVDVLVKDDALEVLANMSTTNVSKIMTSIVMTLEGSQTVHEAAVLMSDNQIGSIVVTKDGAPFAIVTQSDIVRWVPVDKELAVTKLEDLASQPLITARAGTTVEEAARIMIGRRIHRLPIVEDDKLLGIVTITDLAMFLSPSRRPGLASSVFQAMSRGRKK